MRRSSARPTALGAKGILAAAVLTVMPLLGSGSLASAAPADPILSGSPVGVAEAPNGSHLDHIETLDGRTVLLWVYSASMDKVVPLDVWRPADTSTPAPTLYLLNGAGGGEDNATWRMRTDAMEFLGDKHVNVVSPVAGKWSYYTDWESEDPVLGVNKWETFLTQELPPIVDAVLGTNGVNSIAGLSMAGTSVLSLAQKAGDLYKGVAAYSGCAQTSDPLGQQAVKLVVETWGGGNVENMWGPLNSAAWRANDPYLHAEQLRGRQLYISTGSGIPGQYDTLNGPGIDGDPATLANQAAVGGVIEAATNACTHNLKARLDELGIPATYEFRQTGSHSWAYWQDDLKNSWPVLAESLGI